jgi:hypothetical protein
MKPDAEQLAKAFQAACSDLKPKGRLPEGMDHEKATRAILAFGVLRLHETADALVALLHDEDDTPDWLPGSSMPDEGLSPEKAAQWMRDQDLAMVRSVMSRVLRVVADNETEPTTEARALCRALANDLEAGEHSILEVLERNYDSARAEPEPTCTVPGCTEPPTHRVEGARFCDHHVGDAAEHLREVDGG